MSAKKAKRVHPAPAPRVAPARAVSDGPNPPDETGGSTAAEPVAWYDSADPRKRRVARIALIVLWIYVGALWLLAMDQTFDWGIFGPKTPILD